MFLLIGLDTILHRNVSVEMSKPKVDLSLPDQMKKQDLIARNSHRTEKKKHGIYKFQIMNEKQSFFSINHHFQNKHYLR